MHFTTVTSENTRVQHEWWNAIQLDGEYSYSWHYLFIRTCLCLSLVRWSEMSLRFGQDLGRRLRIEVLLTDARALAKSVQWENFRLRRLIFSSHEVSKLKREGSLNQWETNFPCMMSKWSIRFYWFYSFSWWNVLKSGEENQIWANSSSFSLDRWINLIEKWVLFVVRTSFIEWSLKPLHWNSPQIISSFILIVNGEQVYLEWSRFVDSPRCHLNDSFFSKELKSKENSFIEQFIERLNLIRRLNLFQSLAEFISMADEPSEPSFVFHFVFFASTHQSTHANNDGCSARITNHSILGK